MTQASYVASKSNNPNLFKFNNKSCSNEKNYKHRNMYNSVKKRLKITSIHKLSKNIVYFYVQVIFTDYYNNGE